MQDAGSVVAAPVTGQWLVLTPPGHAAGAFDLVAVDATTGRYARRGRWEYLAGRVRVEDVHGWSRPVVAPSAGEVVTAHDGERDRRRLVPLVDAPTGLVVRPLLQRGRVAGMAGNHVVVSTAAGYVLLAHLQQASVAVRPGERVSAGQHLGRIGNSGSSLGPHLHVQVMEGPDPAAARIVPFRVAAYDVWTGQAWRPRVKATLPSRATRVRFPE